MKKIIVLLAAISLTACATKPDIIPVAKPEITVVKQIEYVVRIPPKELLTLPENVKDINPDTIKESDIAKWLLEKEKRIAKLEEMLRQIAIFFSLEQIQLDDEARKKNEEELKNSLKK